MVIFHVYAEQINANFFIKNKSTCLNIILNICSSLPCPLCTNHALNFLKQYNFKSIKTKEQLIIFLYKFHNNVNQRLNKPLYDFKSLDIYKRGKILKIMK